MNPHNFWWGKLFVKLQILRRFRRVKNTPSSETTTTNSKESS